MIFQLCFGRYSIIEKKSFGLGGITSADISGFELRFFDCLSDERPVVHGPKVCG